MPAHLLLPDATAELLSQACVLVLNWSRPWKEAANSTLSCSENREEKTSKWLRCWQGWGPWFQGTEAGFAASTESRLGYKDVFFMVSDTFYQVYEARMTPVFHQ